MLALTVAASENMGLPPELWRHIISLAIPVASAASLRGVSHQWRVWADEVAHRHHAAQYDQLLASLRVWDPRRDPLIPPFQGFSDAACCHRFYGAYNRTRFTADDLGAFRRALSATDVILPFRNSHDLIRHRMAWSAALDEACANSGQGGSWMGILLRLLWAEDDDAARLDRFHKCRPMRLEVVKRVLDIWFKQTPDRAIVAILYLLDLACRDHGLDGWCPVDIKRVLVKATLQEALYTLTQRQYTMGADEMPSYLIPCFQSSAADRPTARAPCRR